MTDLATGPAATVEAPAVTLPDPEWATPAFPLTDLQAAYMVGTTRLIELGGFRPTWFVDLEAVGFDPDRAAAALDRVVARHEQLRTVMRTDGTQRVLTELAARPSPLSVRDLRGRPAEVQRAVLADSRRDLYDTGPDPTVWPLFRLAAFRLRRHRWRLHIALSLPLLDGHGIRQVVADWMRWYADPAAEPPAPPATYRTVLSELRAADDGADWAYWRDRLDALPDAPTLPLQRQPASLDPVRFTRRAHVLSAARWQRLCRHFRGHRIMPTTALLHVFAEVLGAWSASPRFSLNILHQNWAGGHPHAAAVVGQFGSNVPLAVDLSGDGDFWARGQALQRQLWADLAHSGVSAVRITRELSTRRGWTSRAALPYVFTSMIGSGPEPAAPPGLTLRLADSALRTPHVLLDNQVQDGPDGGVVCVWDTVDDAFPDGLPAAMFTAYARMLDTLSTDEAPGEPDPVPPEHRRRIAALNPAPAGVPGGRLEDGFLDWAARTPEAPAVVTAEHRLTYRDLDRRSAAVAAWLRERGVGPGDLVPVVMVKGWEQVVAVLGVLRAGAAYCPVDANLPAERIRHLVEQVEAKVLLDQAAHPCTAVRRAALHVDTAGETDPVTIPRLDGGGDRLAYVIYTSGSTGRPKGAALEHAAVLNTVVDVNQRIGLGPRDRVFAVSSLSFDLSVWDVFGTLAAGAALVMPEPAARPDPAAWAALAAEHGVTVWNSVPALAEMLAEQVAYASGTARPPLRVVLMSGDWVPTTLPGRLRDLWPGLRVVAMGGATEAAIWSNVYEVEAVDPGWRSIPYGRPLTNQTMVVLDDRYRLRPPWATGGIYIGGAGLARCYWRDPERTAERFVRHPVTGERLYRTGDLGRHWPDGTIEFLGREDRQMKIQGFRVEPGEVEAALAEHPGVRDAAVAVEAVTTQDVAAQRRLVAVVTGRPGMRPRPAGLIEHLRGRLPHYMVPARIVVVDALPLSANGKVDVAQALARADETPERAEPTAAADAGVVDRLRALWTDVLGVAPAGPDADFFAGGGTSLLALRLAHRIRDTFEIDLPLGQVFEAPTLRALAARIGKRPAAATAAVVLRDGSGPVLALFHPVGGSIAAYLSMAKVWPGRVVAFQSPGLTADTPGHPDLRAMATAYRGEMAVEDGMVLAGWSMGGVLAHEVGRQLAAHGIRADVCLIDSTVDNPAPSHEAGAYREFLSDLARGELTEPMLRALDHAAPGTLPEVAHRLAVAHRLVPADLGAVDFQRLASVHRTNLRLLAAYRPGRSPQRTLLHVAARLERPDPVHLWRSRCPDLTAEMWPDDHYTIAAPPRLTTITARLLAWHAR